MASKIYYCVCEDWSERITVNSFGGANRKQERGYALTMFKVCHAIFDSYAAAQRKAAELRASIARNRAQQAPQVATQPPAEERHLDEQSGGNPPLDVIDPEQTMTAEEIKAGIKAGMQAEMEEREEQKARRNARSLD